MPRFYFDLWDETKINFADVGLELSGLEAAFEEAIRGARDMLRDARIMNRNAASWVYQVRDEKGTILFTVPFSCSTSPDGCRLRQHVCRSRYQAGPRALLSRSPH